VGSGWNILTVYVSSEQGDSAWHPLCFGMVKLPLNQWKMPVSLTSNSEVLHIVGRDLDLRGIKTFILRCDADVFIVTGGYQSPPAVMPVSVHYAHSDIERLIGDPDRDCVAPRRDFSSLAEILSAIGSYVSRKQGQLISVSNTASTPTIPIVIAKYVSFYSQPVVEMFKGSAIYELCVSVYKTKSSEKRCTRYTRFSDLGNSDQRCG